MKAVISPRFQAATCSSITARIAALSPVSPATCATTTGCMPWIRPTPPIKKANPRTRITPRLRIVFPPLSLYNESMGSATTTVAASQPFRIVHTVCSHDCPDSCAVLVTVGAEGRAVKVAGDPSHPVTQGFLCGKVAKYLDRVYSPQRILHPLRRKPGVPKGPLEKGRELESFEQVSWDEALDAIAARLQQVS